MTEHKPKQGDDADAEQDLEALFAIAKPRPAPGELVTRRIRNAVHAQWQDATAKSARRSTGRYMAVAAAVFAAIALAFIMTTTQVGPAGVVFDGVTIARVNGDASIKSSAGLLKALEENSNVSLAKGDVLETSMRSGATLKLDGHRELRMAGNSRATVVDASTIRLERGQIYFDSGSSVHSAGTITIDTEHGQVRHLGTRFIVTLAPSQVRVDVRDGRVEINSPAGTHALADSGQMLVMDEQGKTEHGVSEGFGPQWSWVELLVPPMAIEGQSLYSIIEWAAHETGHPVEYASMALEANARATVLHGDLVLDEPMRGLSQVMLTTRMDFSLDHNVIKIISRT